MPTFTQTLRYGLRWLTGANVISDIDAGFQALAEDVDAKMTGWLTGPLSSRPTSTGTTPGVAGRIYFATDTGQVFLDTGTSWIEFTLGGAPTSVPTATILAYGGSTAPTGYLACDGAAVDRTTYADLFAAIGTAHGAGNGTSTFNVPDLRGRTAVGAGQGTGLTNWTLGSKFGEESHQLTTAELASHAHGGSVATGGAHSHGGTIGAVADHVHGGAVGAAPVVASGYELPYSPSAWVQAALTSPGNALAVIPTTAGAIDGTGGNHSHGLTINAAGGHSHGLTINSGGDHSHGLSINAAGTGQAHNNVQPSTGVSYVIKT